MRSHKKTHAVDLDGTLAVYTKFVNAYHIGKPVDTMVDRVKGWLDRGDDVYIFTARLSESGHTKQDRDIIKTIEDWCLEHIGVKLPVTNIKLKIFTDFWDDRAHKVQKNTGEVLL